ncbi:MAG: hypothetical protein NTNFB02_11250 [Nitrospira sp.]
MATADASGIGRRFLRSNQSTRGVSVGETDPLDNSLVQAWAKWGLVWLTFFPFVGVLVSIQLHNPEFLGGASFLTFGRLRPVHTNGVIFGSFTTAFIGLLY